MACRCVQPHRIICDHGGARRFDSRYQHSYRARKMVSFISPHVEWLSLIAFPTNGLLPRRNASQVLDVALGARLWTSKIAFILR